MMETITIAIGAAISAAYLIWQYGHDLVDFEDFEDFENFDEEGGEN
jgi:hypothetical protein